MAIHRGKLSAFFPWYDYLSMLIRVTLKFTKLYSHFVIVYKPNQPNFRPLAHHLSRITRSPFEALSALLSLEALST